MDHEGPWVAVGVAPTTVKVVGPFDRYQDAAAETVMLAMDDVAWTVEPLLTPTV